MNHPDRTPIPLDPREGGALNWLDMVDEEGRVVIEFLGPAYPNAPNSQEAWLIEQLREDNHQVFFFRTLAHRGMNLDFQLIESRPLNRFSLTRGSVPLAQLLSMPNEDPATELAQMREFLEWVDTKRQGVGRDGGEATIQWYRGGYRQRGLEWAGVKDDATREQLNEKLSQWRQKPWFQRWYDTNMTGFSKVRMGPHCWLAMSSLVPDRQWAQLMGPRRTTKSSFSP